MSDPPPDETPAPSSSPRPETLLTAAKRVIRFIRVDDQHDGGLLSRQTIVANETLAREVDREEKRVAREEMEGTTK